MIKHRFIVRGADDFKIFAAIPCERQVLTWKKWVRPPDWEGLHEVGNRLLHILTVLLECLVPGREKLEDLSQYGISLTRDRTRTADELAKVDSASNKLKEERREQAERVRQAESTYRAGVAALQALLAEPAGGDFASRAIEIRRVILTCAGDDGGAQDILALVENDTRTAVEFFNSYRSNHDRSNEARQTVTRLLHMYDQLLNHLDSVQVHRRDLVRCLDTAMIELLSSEPLPDTPCPPGTPFAAYTIEFQGSVFSIVEGHAWVAARPRPPQAVIDRAAALVTDAALDKLAEGVITDDARRVVDTLTDHAFDATDDEKRVVEIVTQMLVERGLNPKAPERIPVVEVDARDANHVREAERRDELAQRAPKVRTIKFHVSPPRYLREAAERIFATPGKHKKAHWVIGHWRNQAYGTEHREHRQKWIKPHIRGLGEAGAVVARVAASDEEVAAIEPPTSPPPPPTLH